MSKLQLASIMGASASVSANGNSIAAVRADFNEASGAVDHAEGVADSLSAPVDSAMESLDAVDNIQEQCTNMFTKEEASMTPNESRLVAMQMHNALGEFANLGDLPTAEAFGDEETEAAAATVATIEGVGKTLKNIWVALKKAASKAWAAVKNFFTALFGGAGKMEEMFKKLGEELAKKGDLKKDATITQPYSTQLSVKGKHDNKTIVDGSAEVVGMGAMLDHTSNVATTMMESASAAFVKSHKADEPDAVWKEAGDALVKVVKTKKADNAVLPGEKLFVMAFDDTQVENDDGIGMFEAVMTSAGRIESHPDYASKKVSVKKDGDVLSVAELGKVIENGKLIGKAIEGKSKVIDEINKLSNEAIKAAEGLVKDSDAGKLTNWNNQRKLNRVIRLASKDVTKAVKSVSSYMYGAGRAYINVVEANMAKYKAKDDKKS